jgi:hypothetical protein
VRAYTKLTIYGISTSVDEWNDCIAYKERNFPLLIGENSCLCEFMTRDYKTQSQSSNSTFLSPINATYHAAQLRKTHFGFCIRETSSFGVMEAKNAFANVRLTSRPLIRKLLNRFEAEELANIFCLDSRGASKPTIIKSLLDEHLARDLTSFCRIFGSQIFRRHKASVADFFFFSWSWAGKAFWRRAALGSIFLVDNQAGSILFYYFTVISLRQFDF